MPNESGMISEETSSGSYPVIGRKGLRRNIGRGLCQVAGRLGRLDEDARGFYISSTKEGKPIRRFRSGDRFTQYVEGQYGLYSRHYEVLVDKQPSDYWAGILDFF